MEKSKYADRYWELPSRRMDYFCTLHLTAFGCIVEARAGMGGKMGEGEEKCRDRSGH